MFSQLPSCAVLSVRDTFDSMRAGGAYWGISYWHSFVKALIIVRRQSLSSFVRYLASLIATDGNLVSSAGFPCLENYSIIYTNYFLFSKRY